MESKYYTPKIEEFHVGFEYEFMPLETSENYKTYDFPKYPSNATYIKYDTKNSLEVIELFLKEKQIRVKFLDQKDIESLGFIMSIDSPDFDLFQLGKYPSYKCFFHVNLKGNRTEDFNCILKIKDQICFKGTIRNKSELKKLMQMLNIKVNES